MYMYYTNNSVNIPDLILMKREFQIVDDMEWYSRLLMEHLRKPTQLDGIPVPLYILKTIHEKQKIIRSSGFPDVTDIASCLSNVACALHLGLKEDNKTLGKPRIHKKTTFEGTFLRCQITTRASLLHIIKEHQDILFELNRVQKKHGNNHQEMIEYRKKLQNIQKKMSDGNGKSCIKLQIQKHFLSKHLDAVTKRDKRVYKQLSELIAGTADFSSNIQKIAKQMEMQSLRIIRDKVRIIQNNLIVALSGLEKDDRTKSLEDSIDSLCSLINTETFYDYFSQHYKYPDVKECFLELGRPIKLPYPIYKESEGKTNLSTTRISLQKAITHNNLYVPKHSTVTVRTDSDYKPGFINKEKDIEVHCRLWLLEKSVGFGWYKDSRLGRKTWGFCSVLPLEGKHTNNF